MKTKLKMIRNHFDCRWICWTFKVNSLDHKLWRLLKLKENSSDYRPFSHFRYLKHPKFLIHSKSRLTKSWPNAIDSSVPIAFFRQVIWGLEWIASNIMESNFAGFFEWCNELDFEEQRAAFRHSLQSPLFCPDCYFPRIYIKFEKNYTRNHEQEFAGLWSDTKSSVLKTC
jgi:hypothetical protein